MNRSCVVPQRFADYESDSDNAPTHASSAADTAVRSAGGTPSSVLLGEVCSGVATSDVCALVDVPLSVVDSLYRVSASASVAQCACHANST